LKRGLGGLFSSTFEGLQGGKIVKSFGKSSVSCYYTLGAGGCDWKMTFAGVGRLEAARERVGLTIINEIYKNTDAL
jgi:hypothetical protein